MNHWDEIRTAAAVARLGTISAAAKVLGVHRATVTRHIDTLEAALGATLFQRHARGFSPTELGCDLLRIADATDAQFGALFRLARGGGGGTLTGLFTITCLDVLVATVLPIITAFQAEHRALRVHLVSSDRVLKLEYGEADIAFRIGPKPDHPDNVVLPLQRLPVGLYGPTADAERFAGPGQLAPATPYFAWMRDSIAPEQICLTSDSIAALWAAVQSGSLAGFLPRVMAEAAGLVELAPAQEEWHEQIWAVTHVDLHRSAKVQAFVQTMKRVVV
ncbi:MAG: LysR family transcriptional regulator [Pseudomonadota bacterium]